MFIIWLSEQFNVFNIDKLLISNIDFISLLEISKSVIYSFIGAPSCNHLLYSLIDHFIK